MADQTPAILFANEAFYLAFQNTDIAAMDDIWSNRDNVSCLHPGWPPLIGREEVMESWRGILANPQQQAVEMHGAIAEVYGETAVVICYERLGEFTLVATNVFVQEDKLWKLVHHQSGETQAPPEGADDGPRERMQ